MSGGLDGRSVIVTGAGSGIGRAAALAFAKEGARVVAADLNAEGAREVVKEIEQAGGSAVAVVGDLSEQAVVDQVVETAVERFGGVDVLVNNAGIMDRMSALADVTDAEWERVIRVNLTAPVPAHPRGAAACSGRAEVPSSTRRPRPACGAARRARRTRRRSTAWWD